MKRNEVEAVAKALLKSYCPLSWPLAWEGSNEATRDGWRRSAREIIGVLDRVRRKG